jgi:hypothetical protein
MKKKEIWITAIIAVIAVAAILIVNLVRAQNKSNVDAQASAGTATGIPTEQAVGQWVAVIHA